MITSSERKISQELLDAREQNRKDYQYLVNKIRTQTKVLEMKEKKKKEMHKKFEEREKRKEKVLQENEKINLEKIEKIKERQNRYQKKPILSKGKFVQKNENSNFNYIPILENNEYHRVSYQNQISKKIDLFSTNKKNHLKEIEEKFGNQNKEVAEKHKKIMEQQKEDNGTLKKDLDLQGAIQLENYSNYKKNQKIRALEYHEKLNEKAQEVLNRKKNLMSYKEEDIKKIVNDIQEGKFIYGNEKLVDKEKLENTKVSDKFAETKKKQMEKIENHYIEMKSNHNEILMKELQKFHNSNKMELERDKKQKKSLLNTVFSQKQLEEKLLELNKQIEQVKNNSVCKMDPTKIDIDI